MDKSLLTKCPHCETLFRIQYDHLAIAGGEVRCGVCYKVFNAQAQGLSYSEGPGSDADTTFHRTPETSEQAEDIQAIEEAMPAGDDTEPSLDHISQLNIQSDSVEKRLFPAHNRPKSDRPLLWSALSIVALVVAGSQWLWFNKDTYAGSPQWRSYYQTACQQLGCELPVYSDLRLLRTERLAVRSHQDYNNALTVDLIVTNAAQFEQPMPALAMAFYGINGETLSQRAFQPVDYLPDQLKSKTVLPAGTPMHVSFSIIDPGEEAVNYGLELLAAN